MKKIEKMIEWMVNHKKENCNARYSMVTRFGNPNYDCSSAIHYALRFAGFVPSNFPIGNTETMYKMKGKYFKEIYSYNEVKRGDIFILGREKHSLGEYGHTGIFLDKNTIIHCNYTGNGITVNPASYELKCRRSETERYFRLISSESGSKTEVKTNFELLGNKNLKCTLTENIWVREDKSIKAKAYAKLPKGTTIKYDASYVGDGYYWLEYTHTLKDGTKKKLYMPFREVGKKEYWVKFD